MELKQILLILLLISLILYALLNVAYTASEINPPKWIWISSASVVALLALGFYVDNLKWHTVYTIFVQPTTIYILICSVVYYVLARQYPEDKNLVTTDSLWLMSMILWLCTDALKFVYSRWTEFILNLIVFIIPFYRVFYATWTWEKTIIWRDLSDVGLKRTLSATLMLAIASSSVSILKKGCYFRFIRAKVNRPRPGQSIFEAEQEAPLPGNRQPRRLSSIHNVMRRVSLLTRDEPEVWPNLQYYVRPFVIIAAIGGVVVTTLQIKYSTQMIMVIESGVVTIILGLYCWNNIDWDRVKMLLHEPGIYWLLILFAFEGVLKVTVDTTENIEDDRNWVHLAQGYLFLIGISFWIMTDCFYFVDNVLVMILSLLVFMAIIYNFYDVLTVDDTFGGNPVIIDYKNGLRRKDAKMMIYSSVFLVLLRTIPSIIKNKCRKLLFIQPPLQNPVLSRVIFAFRQPNTQKISVAPKVQNLVPMEMSVSQNDNGADIPEKWRHDRWSMARMNHDLGNLNNTATKPHLGRPGRQRGTVLSFNKSESAKAELDYFKRGSQCAMAIAEITHEIADLTEQGGFPEINVVQK